MAQKNTLFSEVDESAPSLATSILVKTPRLFLNHMLNRSVPYLFRNAAE